MSSGPLEALAAVDRADPRSLVGQIEDQVRAAIRAGRLRPGAALPSTRVLAGQLEVSRPVVVEAYAQLAAEGYLDLRQGAQPRVSAAARPSPPPTVAAEPEMVRPRYDFRPAVPDLAAFPRAAWLRATRAALETMDATELGYRPDGGAPVLREVLADYLGRVRGVAVTPETVVVTSGFGNARALVCRALAAAGVRRVAIEDPSYSEHETFIAAGLQMIPVPVDGDGLRIDRLEAADVQAVFVTPAHQFPTGAVLSGPRRTALLAWLRARDAIAVEDDYDSEHRYDRAPVGALQGLDPERVVYAGTVSKTLAPALRLGWLAPPPRLLPAILAELRASGAGAPRIDQHALAALMASGAFDRHLRRMRLRYRARRDALLAALAEHLPQAQVGGIAAGLHATVSLPDGLDEAEMVAAAARRGVVVQALGPHRLASRGPPTLLVGYGQAAEPEIRTGVRALAAAIASLG